jgi:hypothetical protein
MLKLALTWLRRFAAFGVLVVGVVCLLTLVSNWQQRYWVESQRVNFERLPSDRVLDAARTLASEGPHALPELVSALGSMQASVATAAQQVVLEELERMESQSDRKSAQARVILAESLAQHALEFGPTTTRFAAHLAERLLRDDQQRLTSDERMRLIDSCGIVIHHASRQVDVALLASTMDLNWQETPPPMPWEATIALLREAEDKREQKLPASFADRGISPDGVQVPALPDSAREAIAGLNGVETGTADGMAPKPLPEVSGALADDQYDRPEKFRKPLELRRLPKRNTSVSSDTSAANPKDGTNSPQMLSPSESAVRQALPSRSKSGRSGGPPRDETMIRLLQALVDADQQAANRAATALTERGLPKQHLELAKRLADPDPEVRKSLVDILPRTAGLDARPWLMWLAHDDDAGVRFAAMSMIATSQDPRLCEKIEQMARNDDDERIVALADRLLERRTGTGNP